VSFTGSTAVGRIVSQKTAPTFKKVHLEMGGKNVIMIMDDADIDLAVEGCLWGGFGTTGQALQRRRARVAGPRERVPHVSWIGLWRARKPCALGDGSDPAADMGPLVSPGQLQTVVRYRSRSSAGPKGRAWFPEVIRSQRGRMRTAISRADDLRRRVAPDAHSHRRKSSGRSCR